jgi:hypothetical protein
VTFDQRNFVIFDEYNTSTASHVGLRVSLSCSSERA